MIIENGTAIVLVYVLVSTGVIITFLLAVFVIGWFIGRCASAAADSAERVAYQCPKRIRCECPRPELPRKVPPPAGAPPECLFSEVVRKRVGAIPDRRR
jgi:hypothetical protein